MFKSGRKGDLVRFLVVKKKAGGSRGGGASPAGGVGEGRSLLPCHH